MNTTLIQVEIVIPSQTRYLDFIGGIGERLVKELDDFSGDLEELAYQLNLVLTEATANVIKHAASTADKNSVKVVISIERDELTIKVYDRGAGFVLEDVPLPDLDHPKEHGMGLFFIRSIMDAVTYTTHSEANVLEMKKKLKPLTVTHSPDGNG